MSILLPQLSTPSYASGFARGAGESAHPGLWKGLVGAWCPNLGNTGLRLYDMSGHENHGTLSGTGVDLETAWARSGYTAANPLAIDQDANNPSWISLDREIALTPPWSVVQWVKVMASAQNMTVGYVGDGNNYLYLSSGSLMRFKADSAVAHDQIVDLDYLNKWRQFAMRTDAAGWGTVSFEAANDIALTGGVVGVDFKINALGAGYSTYTSYDLVGLLGPTYVYSRRISDREAAELYRDPLAPFRKRTRLAFSTGEVAPPVGNPGKRHPLRGVFARGPV